MARKTNPLRLFFKIAKDAERQYKKSIREAEKWQRQQEILKAKLEKEAKREIILKNKQTQQNTKLQLKLEKEKKRLLEEKEKALFNEKVENYFSDENKQEIQNLKNDIDLFYKSWNNELSKIHSSPKSIKNNR